MIFWPHLRALLHNGLISTLRPYQRAAFENGFGCPEVKTETRGIRHCSLMWLDRGVDVQGPVDDNDHRVRRVMYQKEA